jgi:hypothetical protein
MVTASAHILVEAGSSLRSQERNCILSLHREPGQSHLAGVTPLFFRQLLNEPLQQMFFLEVISLKARAIETNRNDRNLLENPKKS